MAALNPKVRTELLEAFRKELFTTPRRFQYLEKVQIIQENSRLAGNKRMAFTSNGELYEYGQRMKGKQPRPNILQSGVRLRFKKYLADCAVVDEEEAFVMGYLTHAMAHTDSSRDIYRLIPDVLHHVIRDFQALMPGEPVYNDKEIEEFLAQNDKYIRLLKSRLLMNLIDVS